MNADTVTNKRGCISELLVTLIYGMTICRRGEFRCTGVWAQGEGGEAGLASANPPCRCSGLFSVSLAHPGLSQAEHQSAQMGRDPKGRWHYLCMLSALCPRLQTEVSTADTHGYSAVSTADTHGYSTVSTADTHGYSGCLLYGAGVRARQLSLQKCLLSLKN